MVEKTLNDLFYSQLKDIYYAEKKIYRTLPKMAKATKLPELKQAFMAHREETQGHIERLEQVFEIIGKRPQTKPLRSNQWCYCGGGGNNRRFWRKRRDRHRSGRGRTGGRALRDGALRSAHRVGESAWNTTGCSVAERNPARGNEGRQAADEHRRD
jgi:hypothetical protein